MAACDSVPETRCGRESARPTPIASNSSNRTHRTDAADDVAASTPIVPVAGKPVLWGYVDGAGVAHFAASQIDSHYDQVLRETEGRRVPGKTQGTDGLLTWLEISPDVKALQPVLDEAARSTGVDEALLKAVITVESSYNARAVSPRGAVGLMQLTPVTADRYGTREERQVPAAERMLDARTNVFTGARMLADLMRRYGGIDIALAAWNAGEGSVRKAGGQMPEIAETEAHVHMVLELYWALLQRKLPRHAHGVEVVS
ncbi:MAG: lytic transglycosylase domain-containing protein [Caulobacter sp.]|nr:lytic transglycosylase domain-containing protein [Vitreoscilla sp.]